MINSKRNRRFQFHIIAWFRVLLWWGSEMARQIIQARKPQAQIQYVFQSSTHFPKSMWGISRNRAFCLVQRSRTTETRIHLFPARSQN